MEITSRRALTPTANDAAAGASNRASNAMVAIGSVRRRNATTAPMATGTADVTRNRPSKPVEWRRLPSPCKNNSHGPRYCKKSTRASPSPPKRPWPLKTLTSLSRAVVLLADATRMTVAAATGPTIATSRAPRMLPRNANSTIKSRRGVKKRPG